MQSRALAAGLLASVFLLGAPLASQAATTDTHQTVHKHHRIHHYARHMRRAPAHQYYFWRHGHLRKGYYVQGRPHRPF